MRVTIELEQSDRDRRTADVDATPHDTLGDVARRVASQLDISAEELLDHLEISGSYPDEQVEIATLRMTDGNWRSKLVCIEAHFEGEKPVLRRFSPRRTWGDVHRWACRRFNVATDACANLELRADGPGGGILNETKPIGWFEGCKMVWLVAPGPEQNG